MLSKDQGLKKGGDFKRREGPADRQDWASSGTKNWRNNQQLLFGPRTQNTSRERQERVT